MKSRLSTIWIFATLNYLYCDVVTLMDPALLKGFLAGSIGGMEVSSAFLLAAGALVEIPMAMVLLSRILDHGPNRVANVVAGAIMTVVQLASLFVRTPAPYYVFFSAAEIAATAAVVWLAWRWSRTTGLGPVQSLGEPDHGDAQPAGAERTRNQRDERPQQLHVGLNGT